MVPADSELVNVIGDLGGLTPVSTDGGKGASVPLSRGAEKRGNGAGSAAA